MVSSSLLTEMRVMATLPSPRAICHFLQCSSSSTPVTRTRRNLKLMASTGHLVVVVVVLLLVSLHVAASMSPASPNATVHDLLPQLGLPMGLLPGNVVNYSRSDDGHFVVELSEPCYVQFSELAYYERTVRGNISYGLVSGLSGIQARKFFIWVAITRISVNKDDDTIQFDTGLVSENHPASEFDAIRPCKKWASSSGGPAPAAVAAAA